MQAVDLVLHVCFLVFSSPTEVAANAQFFQQSGMENFDKSNDNLSKGALFSDSFLDSLLCTVSS